jgi:hypothetical protein
MYIYDCNTLMVLLFSNEDCTDVNLRGNELHRICFTYLNKSTTKLPYICCCDFSMIQPRNLIN